MAKKENKVVEAGNKVKVHYTGTLDDGSEFDSSNGREPLEFVAGSGHVIKGFDDGVIGMKLNEDKKVHIKAEDAYGSRDAKLVQNIPNSVLGGKKFEKGQMLTLKSPDGQIIRALVIELTKDGVMIDLNHPLAGKNLNFDIKVIGID